MGFGARTPSWHNYLTQVGRLLRRRPGPPSLRHQPEKSRRGSSWDRRPGGALVTLPCHAGFFTVLFLGPTWPPESGSLSLPSSFMLPLYPPATSARGWSESRRPPGTSVTVRRDRGPERGRLRRGQRGKGERGARPPLDHAAPVDGNRGTRRGAGRGAPVRPPIPLSGVRFILCILAATPTKRILPILAPPGRCTVGFCRTLVTAGEFVRIGTY